MAVITGLSAVLSLKFVAGVSVMIENRLIPASLLVAGCAVFTEAVTMNVSYRMAIDTPLWRIFVLLIDVARIASHALV